MGALERADDPTRGDTEDPIGGGEISRDYALRTRVAPEHALVLPAAARL
jgi:hypothetical protein